MVVALSRGRFSLSCRHRGLACSLPAYDDHEGSNAGISSARASQRDPSYAQATM